MAGISYASCVLRLIGRTEVRVPEAEASTSAVIRPECEELRHNHEFVAVLPSARMLPLRRVQLRKPQNAWPVDRSHCRGNYRAFPDLVAAEALYFVIFVSTAHLALLAHLAHHLSSFERCRSRSDMHLVSTDPHRDRRALENHGQELGRPYGARSIAAAFPGQRPLAAGLSWATIGAPSGSEERRHTARFFIPFGGPKAHEPSGVKTPCFSGRLRHE